MLNDRWVCRVLLFRSKKHINLFLSLIVLTMVGGGPVISGEVLDAPSPQEVAYMVAAQAEHQNCAGFSRGDAVLQLRGFATREEAEEAALRYVNCLGSFDAITEWLEGEGFSEIYVREYRFPLMTSSRESHYQYKYALSGVRPINTHPLIWGGLVSRFIQRTLSYRLSIAVVFDENKTATRLTFVLNTL